MASIRRDSLIVFSGNYIDIFIAETLSTGFQVLICTKMNSSCQKVVYSVLPNVLVYEFGADFLSRDNATHVVSLERNRNAMSESHTYCTVENIGGRKASKSNLLP